MGEIMKVNFDFHPFSFLAGIGFSAILVAMGYLVYFK